MEKKKQNENYPRTKWGLLVVILVVLILFGALFISTVFSVFHEKKSSILASGDVALIKIQGPIVTDGKSFFGDTTASSSEITSFIEDASEDPGIIAIMLEINSPGGSAVASDEIVAALKQTTKPKVAYIREVGASGAYWIASAADYIVAERMSITGSVGVISSYLEFAGLLNDYNVTYRRLVAGKYKDIGSPFRELTTEEEDILKEQLDQIHSIFLSEVSDKRQLTRSQREEVSTGVFFVGIKAKELGLVDELGGKKEAIKYLEDKLGTQVTLVEYETEPTFADLIAGVMAKNSFMLGRGISSVLLEENSITLKT